MGREDERGTREERRVDGREGRGRKEGGWEGEKERKEGGWEEGGREREDRREGMEAGWK